MSRNKKNNETIGDKVNEELAQQASGESTEGEAVQEPSTDETTEIADPATDAPAELADGEQATGDETV